MLNKISPRIRGATRGGFEGVETPAISEFVPFLEWSYLRNKYHSEFKFNQFRKHLLSSKT